MDAILKSQAEQLAREMATHATTPDGLNGLMRATMKTALEHVPNTEMDAHLRRHAEPAVASHNPTLNAPATNETAPCQSRCFGCSF